MFNSSSTSASKAARGGCATEVKAACISRCAERGGAVGMADEAVDTPVVSVAAMSDMLSVRTSSFDFLSTLESKMESAVPVDGTDKNPDHN